MRRRAKAEDSGGSGRPRGGATPVIRRSKTRITIDGREVFDDAFRGALRWSEFTAKLSPADAKRARPIFKRVRDHYRPVLLAQVFDLYGDVFVCAKLITGDHAQALRAVTGLRNREPKL